MAQNITLLGGSYSDVPAVLLPKTGGGTARFDDASVTTAAASDVASGKVFLASDGTITTGTASGGSSKNAQTAQSTNRSTSTAGTEVIYLTCAKSGTYDVYWTTFRSNTSGTWGSRLYIDGTAYENMYTQGWSNHVQNRHIENVNINANQTVAVRVQSRGSSYYGYVGTLTIIEQ